MLSFNSLRPKTVGLIDINIDSDNGLAPYKHNDGLVYYCIYATPGLKELFILSSSLINLLSVCGLQ